MGANFTETASTRAARSVRTISHLVESFDSQLGIHPESSAHLRKSDKKYIKSIVTAHQNQNILVVQTEPRCHSGFKRITPNPLNSLNYTKLEEWIVSTSTSWQLSRVLVQIHLLLTTLSLRRLWVWSRLVIRQQWMWHWFRLTIITYSESIGCIMATGEAPLKERDEGRTSWYLGNRPNEL